MKKAIPIIIAVLLAILGVYYAYTQFTYSEGNRAGVLIKFSKKGNLFKTYEGEVNQIGINPDPKVGLINNIWDFSVKDQAVADQLSHLEGHNVSLHYREIKHAFVWQGETNYFVDKVEEVKP
ncbi:MAG: 6-phosphogluconate dehydrogenase [Bacteroidetes bacterium]|nr:6-phosphogluconate dehydrogenase [Bacteroidota bacterium]